MRKGIYIDIGEKHMQSILSPHSVNKKSIIFPITESKYMFLEDEEESASVKCAVVFVLAFLCAYDRIYNIFVIYFIQRKERDKRQFDDEVRIHG